MNARLLLLSSLFFATACTDLGKIPGVDDADGDGDPDVTDCDPDNAYVGALNVEICDDGFDNDCDSLADDDDPDCATDDGDTGTTDETVVWPPDPPEAGYVDYADGDTTILNGFPVWDGVYVDGSLILSDPFYNVNDGQVCSWDYSDVSLGGFRDVSDANWCIEGTGTDYLGFYARASEYWVAITALDGSDGSSGHGAGYVFSRSALDALPPGTTVSAMDANFIFDGIDTGSYAKALLLKDDTLYMGDSNGTSELGQVYAIDLTDPATTSGYVIDSGSLVIETYHPDEWPNYFLVQCEDPATGNVTWATTALESNTLSFWTQPSGTGPWSTETALQVATDVSLGFDIECDLDTDGDGFPDLLASADELDLTFRFPTALTAPTDIQTLAHQRWLEDPYAPHEEASEQIELVNFDGERWYVVGAKHARNPDGDRVGAIYLTPDSRLFTLPSDHTHAGGTGVAASHAFYGNQIGGIFGQRVFTVGTTLVVSDAANNRTVVVPMPQAMSSGVFGPPPPPSAANFMDTEEWAQRQARLQQPPFALPTAPPSPDSDSTVTFEFR